MPKEEMIKLWKWTEQGDDQFLFDKTVVEAYVRIKFNNEMTLEHFIEDEYNSTHVLEIEHMIDYVKNAKCWK